jgi:hypothetical protein
MIRSVSFRSGILKSHWSATTGNVDGETSPFRRVLGSTGSTEPLNDLAPVVGSSPRDCVSGLDQHKSYPYPTTSQFSYPGSS